MLLLEEDMNFNARAASFSVSALRVPCLNLPASPFSVLTMRFVTSAGSEGKGIPAGFNRHSKQRVWPSSNQPYIQLRPSQDGNRLSAPCWKNRERTFLQVGMRRDNPYNGGWALRAAEISEWAQVPLWRAAPWVNVYVLLSSDVDTSLFFPFFGYCYRRSIFFPLALSIYTGEKSTAFLSYTLAYPFFWLCTYEMILNHDKVGPELFYRLGKRFN